MKLRVEVLNSAAVPMQTEEFELNERAADVISTVNAMVEGQLRVTVVLEKVIAVNALPAGSVPRVDA